MLPDSPMWRRQAVLRLGLALQCAGAAWQVGFQGSALIDSRALASSLYLVGLFAVVLPGLGRGLREARGAAQRAATLPRVARIGKGALAGLAALVALETMARTAHGAAFAAPITPFAHAVRYLVPLALILGGSLEIRLVQGAVASVFIAHGVEALLEHPSFVAYLTQVPEIVLGFGPDVRTATALLVPIGVIDILLALALLFRPSRFVLGYMAFWGLLTAGMRTVFYGVEGGHETLIRALNGLAPLALVWGLVPPQRGERPVVASVLPTSCGVVRGKIGASRSAPADAGLRRLCTGRSGLGSRSTRVPGMVRGGSR